MEEVDVEQSDELKAALLLMPEKRYTGTWASNFLYPVTDVDWSC